MSVKVSNLDHLGIVAGIIDEIGIEREINDLLGEQKTEKVTAGQAVKAMVLNGLGLVSSPLYLFSRFFEGKATEHLIGEGIKAEYLNDDRLGRVLDKLYKTGLNKIFVKIALEVVKKYEISTDTVHLDSSSFHLHGQYNRGEIYDRQEEPRAIKITYGYSRDHRPDLKQFMMDLICTDDGDVPLWMRVGDGNESDSKQFIKAMKDFKEQLKWESLIVLDSAFYSQENIQQVKNLKWLSRVPLRVKAAKDLVREINSEDLKNSDRPGYRYTEVKKTYGGIEQRWLLVESETRRESDLKALAKAIQKDATHARQKLRDLKSKSFACIPDARRAAEKLLKKSKYHRLTEIEIKTVSGGKDKNSNYSYRVVANASICEEKVASEQKQAGRFILATNVLDEEELTMEEMLYKYKEQQSTERGFGFLKDPMFLTDSVFLKSPERIEALGLIMGLCLLVYTIGQRQLRRNLNPTEGIKNQLGRLTKKPTLRWIFQCFQSIHVLVIQGAVQISNLTDERLGMLKFFPSCCQRYYLLC